MEKEPTYTLENVQVDCRRLSKEQIKNLKEVVLKKGYVLSQSCKEDVSEDFPFFEHHPRLRSFSMCSLGKRYEYFEITYDKFMELFDSKETKPTQYQIGIDTFERMEANCSKDEILAFIKGNIDKYNWRKKGSDKEDFEKIIEYAKFALKTLNNGVE